MPLTRDIPKPLVPVYNRPVIGHIIKLLKYYHVNDISVTLQHMPSLIMDYLLENFDSRFKYFIEDLPLGTAGSVLNAAGRFDDAFLVISGDALTNIDLSEMYYFHKANKSSFTMAVQKTDNPSLYGVVVANQSGLIAGFQEKPAKKAALSDVINCGIYMIEPEILKYIPRNTSFDFAKNLFPELLNNGVKMYAYMHNRYWCDIGDTDSYYRANMDMLNNKFDYKNFVYDERGSSAAVPNRTPECAGYAENSVIGKNVEITGARVTNSVVWDNTVINRALDNVIVSNEFCIRMFINSDITGAEDPLYY